MSKEDKKLNEPIGTIDAQLDYIQDVEDLRELNDMLTKSMAQLKIQALIKDANLKLIVDSVMRLASRASHEDLLLCGAILGRLAAVARGREQIVFSVVSDLFDAEPATLECLDDVDEKYYAAVSLQHARGEWLTNYCVREAFLLGEAKDARKTLMQTALFHQTNLTDGWGLIKTALPTKSENSVTWFSRMRRTTSVWLEVVKVWTSDVGNHPGLVLAEWLGILLKGDHQGVEDRVLQDITDDALSMLLRIIELRFSHALVAETYAVLDQARTRLGRDRWLDFMSNSKILDAVRMCLKETALVLARQNRTDKEIMDVLCNVYSSRAQISIALKSHFSDAHELDPDVREWWLTGGVAKQSQRNVEHQLGNSEDQQIGTLLIEVESSKPIMEKLGRAVVPFLEISDPPLAATVKKAVAGYSDMARIARQLARMRKLSQTELLGVVSEYNPLQHEMLGGHQPGVRQIKVVRDGIKKEFGGRIKTLVKPWVEPA